VLQQAQLAVTTGEVTGAEVGSPSGLSGPGLVEDDGIGQRQSDGGTPEDQEHRQRLPAQPTYDFHHE
jgi:hypothetical protein